MDGYGNKQRVEGRKAISFQNAPSMTKQSFRDGTRVDAVLKRYATQGVDANNVGLFQQSVASQKFGIADTTYDYQTQLNKLNAVKEYFARLPSRLRDFFRHDPANMLEYMANPGNIEKCVEMGLFAKPEGSERKAKAPEAAAPEVAKPNPGAGGGAPSASSPSKP